ncbi:MAG: SpoIVB peptidase [Lachnospiraceae bacterium]
MEKMKKRYIIYCLITVTIIMGLLNTNTGSANEEKEVSIHNVNEDLLIPGGMPVGIYMETDGVLVLGTDKVKGLDGLTYEPACHLVKSGDYITGINNIVITEKKELVNAVEALTEKHLILKIRRKGTPIEIAFDAIESEQKNYQLGIWVRDNVQGLGTITFLDSQSRFGALGHGINDVDTNELVEISEGKLYETNISSIRKGKTGTPGGMEGIIVYNNYNVLGTITQNTDSGIYGKVEKIDKLFSINTPLSVGSKEEIVEGKATIRCFIHGELKDFDILITKINLQEKEINKGIILEIVDEELLDITGGIIQGMSGSPILQNGKLIGAVTHVFVQDNKKGYGIFIENMLNHVE